VPQVARAAGFLQPETFEAAYFKAFRESPAETRRRGLGASSVPAVTETGEPGVDRRRLAVLSPREHEVSARVAQGMLNKQIGAELGITEATVKAHRGRAMAKLGVGSAAELAKLFGAPGG
jgi:DNA-binding CsgD family transcriptional regulator